MTNFVRGNTIEFTFTFTDTDGNTAVPDTATLTISYCSSGSIATATVTLTNNSNSWEGQWDSSVADDGDVDWHVRTTGATVAAKDGTFFLTANDANP